MSYANFTDKSGPGGIVYNPASPYAREMAKWEMAYSPYGPPGRPREREAHQEYPALFYKVKRATQNGSFVVEHYQQAADENEARNLLSRGYVQGRAEAEQAVKDAEQALALAAAVSNKDDLNMSEKARAERAAFEATTLDHVAEIPSTPISPKRK